ncbi:hypothetical protein J132_05147, partial [Termitomyces sp. J132]
VVRFKSCWFFVELIPVGQANPLEEHLWAAIKQSVINDFGDTGWESPAPSLTVARDQYKIAWGSITLLSSIEGEGTRYIPHVMSLAGTIKQAQLAAIGHNCEAIARR